MKNANTVVVFKDNKSREIHTYVNTEGHGAQMSVEDFVTLLAECYGSPAMTFKKDGFLRLLKAASDNVITQMKFKTLEVAALSIEPGGSSE